MKKTFIVIISILFSLCFAIDIWYLYILFFAPEKVANNTFYVDLQSSSDGSIVKPIIEINYYTNNNKNGYEMFEIKMNTLTDSNKTSILSKGFQYISKDVNGFIDFAYHYNNAVKDKLIKHENGWYNAKDYYSYWGSFSTGINGVTYNYTCDNFSDNSFVSTDETNLDDFFVIEIGNEIYGMKFKGKNTPMNDVTHIADFEDGYDFNVLWGTQNYASYYTYFDVHYLSFLLKRSCGTLKYGTNNMIVFDFDDLFDYYEFDENNGVFSDKIMEDSTKVINYVKNFYAIKVFICEDGAQNSADSLFGLIHGSPNYSVNNDYTNSDYFFGRSIIKATLKDFELINNGSDRFDLKLNTNFINNYKDYKSKIVLDVFIDFENSFNKHNIKVNYPSTETFCGFDVYNVECPGYSIDVGGVYA